MQNVTASYIENFSCIHKSCNSGHSPSQVSHVSQLLWNYGYLNFKNDLLVIKLFCWTSALCSIVKFTITVPHGHLQLRHAFWLWIIQNITYQEMKENIQPPWISREMFTFPWCNLAASQRRSDCTSLNSQSPVDLVSLQWDAVDWSCVMLMGNIHIILYNWQCICWNPVCPRRQGQYSGRSQYRSL